MWKTATDITGMRFGRLVVVGRSSKHGSRQAMWDCVCDCGKRITLPGGSIRSGNTKSCGCLYADTRDINSLRHGMALGGRARSVEYTAFAAAKGRCNNPNNPVYEDYGGRGIKFLFASFEDFYEELGPRPPGVSPGGRALFSLNRIDNDGNYERGNVEWADKSTQMVNRRKRQLARKRGT